MCNTLTVRVPLILLSVEKSGVKISISFLFLVLFL